SIAWSDRRPLRLRRATVSPEPRRDDRSAEAARVELGEPVCLLELRWRRFWSIDRRENDGRDLEKDLRDLASDRRLRRAALSGRAQQATIRWNGRSAGAPLA